MRHFNGAWAARDAINSAISNVEEADTFIVSLNEAVVATVDDATQETTDKITEDAKSASASLENADKNIARAWELDEFLDDNQRSICSALHDSVDARRNMIGSGEAILSVDTTVGSARKELEQAIAKAVEANSKAQEATTAANEYAKYLTGDTQAQVQDATTVVELDNQTIALLDEATTHLENAKTIFGDADYTAYQTYLEKRKEAAQFMLEADNALVSGDFESAGENTDKYNEADASASEAAAALPASTSEIFSEPYTTLTQEARTSYIEASARAQEADVLIRHYQGISVSTSQVATTSSATTPTTSANTPAAPDNASATSEVAKTTSSGNTPATS